MSRDKISKQDSLLVHQTRHDILKKLIEIEKDTQVVPSKTMTCWKRWVQCSFRWIGCESYLLILSRDIGRNRNYLLKLGLCCRNLWFCY